MHPSVSQSRRRMNIPTMKKKVLLPPYPISIELYNAVPQYQSIISSTTTSTTDSSTSDTPTIITRNGTRSSLLYRPEYSTKWLSPIHLEISILDDHDSNSSNNNSNHQHQQSLSDDGTNGITTTTTTNTTKQITPPEDQHLSINENNGRKPSKVILYRSSSSSVLSDHSNNTRDIKHHHRPQPHPERIDTWSNQTTTTITTNNNKLLSSFVSTWYHIADTISEDQLLKLRTTSHIYETICARFATIIPYHHRPQYTRSNVHSPIQNNSNNNNSNNNNNNSELPPITTTNITASNQCDESPTQLLEYRYFLEMNIHPSRLCRIPPSFLTPTSTTTSNNSNNNNSNHNNMIYDRLPINCVIVRFSDQTIRIHPSQYQLLDSYYQFHNTNTNSNSNNNSVTTTPKKNYGGAIIIDPSTTTTILNTKMSSPLSPKNHINNMSLSLNGSFFEDDVFHTLDDVTPNNNPVPPLHDDNDDGGASNHGTITTTTLMYDDRRIQHHDRTNTNIEDCNKPDNGTYNNSSSNNNNTMDKLSFLSLLDSKGNFEIAVENHVDESSPEPPIPPDTSGNLHHGPNDITVNGSIIESDTIRNEIDFLEALIQKETAALSHETQQLKNDTVQVRSLMDQIRNVEEQNRQILPVLYQVQMQEYRDQFILEAQRIRLIRDVARIYPITVVRNVHYSIHGLEIPFDLYSGMVSEEVISAAFGFLCHTTFLISKYLGIHIRYRLHCQSSRSAIQDTNGSTYPLFPGRQVEREQFEYAVHLLHRNIDCICKCRGIQQRLLLQPSNQIHILAKILRIYDKVNDGY